MFDLKLLQFYEPPANLQFVVCDHDMMTDNLITKSWQNANRQRLRDQ